MSIRKNATAKGLLSAALTILVIYGLSYVPAVHRLYARALRMKTTSYVPYMAPDSAFFGGYERMKGPYSKPFDSTMDIIVEGHQLEIDPVTGKYYNATRGYLRVKQEDSSYQDKWMEMREEYNYDTTWKHTPVQPSLPLAKPPAAKAAPDSIHPAGGSAEQKTKNFWKKLRKVRLPYTYKVGGNMLLTITARKVYTEAVNDTIYLNTALTCTASWPGSTATEPVTMEAREVIE